MARYIDADKLCEGLKSMATVQPHDKQNTILGIVSTIKNISTDDVVPREVFEQMQVVKCDRCTERIMSAAAATIFKEIDEIIQKKYDMACRNEEDEELSAATDYLSYIQTDIENLRKKYTE